MDYRLSAVVSKGDKLFVAHGVEIELASQGSTMEEALRNLKEAFHLWLKHADPEDLEMLNKADSPIVTQVAVAA